MRARSGVDVVVLLYRALTSAAVWLVLVPIQIAQIVRGRTSWSELRERLGRAPRIGGGPRLIVHAVSAGEVMSAGAFVRAFADLCPGWTVVVSTGTRDGRRIAADLQRSLPAIEAVCFLPWDRAGAATRWLSALNARALVVVETELWPNLFLACERLHVPLALVSARVFPRDVARYRLVRRFMARVLAVPAFIGAQSLAERDALVQIGAAADGVAVGGALKFDALVHTEAAAPLAAFESMEPRPPIVVAGSTHEQEEDLLLRAFARVRIAFPTLKLALAPRRVTRARAVGDLATRAGFRVWMVSEPPACAVDADVWVTDRIGLLPSFYAAADIAIVGGTFVPVGGHNVLEPASLGRAIVVGPHVGHVAEPVSDLERAGAIVCLPDATVDSVVDAVSRLLTDAPQRARMGAAARAYQRAHAGAATAYARAVASIVGASIAIDDSSARSARA